MNTEESLFAEAVSLPAAERAVLLERACSDQPELRARVEGLIRAHETEGFMKGPVEVDEKIHPINTAPDWARPLPERPGTCIGRYRLLQEIGEGGFGTVWMAEQMEPLTRRVALKLIKAGMDTKQVIARFEAERQALAMMDHPNIARVLDAGATDKGGPFFVMELVKGIPITRFCNEQRLTMRQRLELFVDVCLAINHAHQKGIIHRDIKPSNIMVTLNADRPVVKVIDFGIAKATQAKLTDLTLFTRFEQFIGTPAYMSPEQAGISELDIDTRSDIYSLGVLLYELLTGQPPFDSQFLLSAGFEEMRRIIREVEPSKPSTRAKELVTAGATRGVAPRSPISVHRPAIPTDLDWIVMKALEKDRTRRYETANGLVLDIRRYLADEPVMAGRPSRLYRLQKQARRHKGPLAATVALFLTLAAGIKESARQADAAELARDEARKEAAISNEANDFITELLLRADPEGEVDEQLKVRTVLDRASERIGNRFKDQPLVEASIRAILTRSYWNLGEYWTALKHAERTLELRRPMLGAGHEGSHSPLIELEIFYDEPERRMKALNMREKLVALHSKVLGPDHPVTLDAKSDLAICYFYAGYLEKALQLREENLPLYRKALGSEHNDTLWALNNLANSYDYAGRREEALKMRSQVLAIRLKVLGPEHADTLQAKDRLARTSAGTDAAVKRGKELELREILENLRRNKGNGVRANGLLERTLNIKFQLANVLLLRAAYEQGDWEESIVEANEIVQSLADESIMTSPVGLSWVDRFSRHGHWEQALIICRRVYQIDPQDPWRAFRLGPLLIQSGDNAGFETLRKALVSQASSPLPPTIDPVHGADLIAKILCLKPLTESEALLAIKVADRAIEAGRNEPGLPWCQFTRGLAAYRAGDYASAISIVEAALPMMNSPGRAAALSVLAMAYFRLADNTSARRCLDYGATLLDQIWVSESLPIFRREPHDCLIARILFREAKSLVDERE